jgi:hypothetical protein
MGRHEAARGLWPRLGGRLVPGLPGRISKKYCFTAWFGLRVGWMEHVGGERDLRCLRELLASRFPLPLPLGFGIEKSPYRDQKRARGPFSAPVGEIIIALGDGVAMAALVGDDRYA